jgi:cell division GTPase FtsZ|tara:strand:+ start:4275 stop:5459 length:1185 start_codon:yes stop_codon:yes gene_type:complete
VKILVIGCGQCGGRVADEFVRLNEKARKQRGIQIVTACYAVNTDMADLAGLRFLKSDAHHRIIIGNQKTGAHGVGKINEIGAEIARDESDKVMSAIRRTENFLETDAFLIAASAAGGTGSGSIAVLTQQIKEYFPDKPVYNLIVLPFKHEELTEERIIYNTGTCLKSAFLVADAVFLVDNQGFVRNNLSLRNNLNAINSLVTEPFYNLLCAGEEKKPEYIGSRVLDAGDIIQTLSGWTSIGYGTERETLREPIFRFFEKNDGDFRDKAVKAQEESRAMFTALDGLSLRCNPADARRALYLLCSPPDKMNMDLVEALGNILKSLARDAVIRSGDYPRTKRSRDVTVILSDLKNVGRINDFFTKVILYISTRKKQRGVQSEDRQLEEAFKDIPTLI